MQKMKHRHGFTLLETLLVVSIIAIIASISIASAIVVRKNIQFKQVNDNAYAIYIASQNNLTEMRSMGELHFLEDTSVTDNDENSWTYPALEGNCCYTYSKHANKQSYDLIVPGTLDTHIRNQKVIIEYHPSTGNVYSVFYYEGKEDLEDLYKILSPFRNNTEMFKDYQVGYYTVGNIDAINNEDFVLYEISSDIAYTNQKEASIIVSVPVKDSKDFDIFTNVDAYNYIAKSLEITLTMTGENGETLVNVYRVIDESGNPLLKYTPNDSRYTVDVEIPLDSLTDSFAILGADNAQDAVRNPIVAGDNISVTADVTFDSAQGDPILVINSATIAGINPMFQDLMDNPDYNASQTNTDVKPYILAISNGRHLQNLQYLDPVFAQQIDSIQFTAGEADDSTTNVTPEPTPSESENDATEESTAPEGGNEGATPLVLNWYEGVAFTPVTLPDIPMIKGNGVKIHNLRINSSTGVTIGANQKDVVGLFATLSDTTIENITLVDPIVNGGSAVATGGLIGYADGVTLTNCSITNTANSISGSGDTGGLVGLSSGSTFNACTTSAIVTGSSNAGGLVGKATSKSINDTVVESSFNECTTSATVTNAPTTGGLVGDSANSKFTKCETTAIVTGTYTGGLVGYTDASTFSTCTTGATVTGAAGIVSNVGGLIGYSKNSVLTTCIAQGANVQSGSNSGSDVSGEVKNALGGLIGYATNVDTKNTTYEISSCESKKDVHVTGVAGSYSNLGGVVGYADNAFFSGCKSSAIVNGQVTNGGIPNNNLGGFVGRSQKTRYAVTDVSLSYLPQYAWDAGGFAGYLTNDSIENLEVIFTSTNSGNTITVTNFGGIASINSGGSISLASVVSTTGTSGPAIKHASNIAGFIVSNSGKIQQSFSNVRMENAYCFVKTNDNANGVENCYGWAWGTNNTFMIDNCSRSYFVDGESGNVLFYDAEGNPSEIIINTGILEQQASIDYLNDGYTKNFPWINSGEIPYPALSNMKVAGSYAQPVNIG